MKWRHQRNEESSTSMAILREIIMSIRKWLAAKYFTAASSKKKKPSLREKKMKSEKIFIYLIEGNNLTHRENQSKAYEERKEVKIENIYRNPPAPIYNRPSEKKKRRNRHQATMKSGRPKMLPRNVPIIGNQINRRESRIEKWEMRRPRNEIWKTEIRPWSHPHKSENGINRRRKSASWNRNIREAGGRPPGDPSAREMSINNRRKMKHRNGNVYRKSKKSENINPSAT